MVNKSQNGGVRWLIGLMLLIDVAVMAVIFSVSGFYKDLDTAIYVGQIEMFSGVRADVDDPGTAARFFKPFYGVVGAGLSTVMDPHAAILAINITFFLGLSLVALVFFRELGFDRRFSFWGSVWLVSGYPMLKYGLALGTDISGWFFALTTAALALVAVRRGDARIIVLASLVGFLGSLAKETGVLGLLFSGLYLLAHTGSWDLKKLAAWLAFLCVPFFVLEAAFQAVLRILGAPGFLEWFASNRHVFADDFYTLKYFFSVEGSAFNILLVFAALGSIFALRNGDALARRWLGIHVPLCIASLPVLLWPIFISRVLYAQFLIVLPLALYGLAYLDEWWGNKLLLGATRTSYLLALPIVVSLALFLVSGNGSLFELFKS